MARLTEQEKKDFHELLDESIEKLNSKKNINKKHWSGLSVGVLNKMLMVEAHELDLAYTCGDFEGMSFECDDIINFAMFIKHNISKGEY